MRLRLNLNWLVASLWLLAARVGEGAGGMDALVFQDSLTIKSGLFNKQIQVEQVTLTQRCPVLTIVKPINARCVLQTKR